MKRILFLTNLPSPYRVRFFEKLGSAMEVTVLFHDNRKAHTGRDKTWFVSGNGAFQQVQLEKRVLTKGEDSLCLDVIGWLKKPFDEIVICGYSSPTAMLAIAWLRMKKIPFWMEVDGGLIREDSKLKYHFKKMLVSSASGWFSSGRKTTEYLLHYGARAEKIYPYPFSSLNESDIMEAPVSYEEKTQLRKKLDIREEKMVLSIGQFIPRKGFDVLLRAAAGMDKNTGIYIVGGEPTEEYRKLRNALGLSNVHFVGFQSKDSLAEYYKAADVFVLPTREDIWGLVINEAMAYGLPVITTDRCVAGLELVKEGANGYIVPTEDAHSLAEAIEKVLCSDFRKMGESSLEKIRPYTIENMVKVHIDVFSI